VKFGRNGQPIGDNAGTGGGPNGGQAYLSAGLGGGGGGASTAFNGGNGGLGGGGGSNGPGYQIGGTQPPTIPGKGGRFAGDAADYIAYPFSGVDGGGGGAGLGGAIFNAGTLAITNSTLSGNSAVHGLGVGHAGNGLALGAAIFNYNGTATLTSSTLTGNSTDLGGASIVNVGDGQSREILVHPASVTLSNTSLADRTASGSDYVSLAIYGGTTFDHTPPSPTLNGVPSSSTPTETPLTFTASATDPFPGDLNAGVNFQWQISGGAGQSAFAAKGLTSTAGNPVFLPQGLIHDASNLTVDVTFHTTAGGVILGYQNQPAGTAPSSWVPALYVGTDGRLYAELYNGTAQPLHSSVPVNDGKPHHAVLTVANGTQTLTLDGTTVGTITGALVPLDMVFDQLGTGYTTNWPAGNGGVYPFVGTIDQAVVRDLVNQKGGGADQAVFQPLNLATLPNSLIHDAANLTIIDVTFHTTAGGVILGYQNHPVGTTPINYVPALYVGTDGRLHAGLFDGSYQQIVSSGRVNDGQQHHVELVATANSQTLYVDNVFSGTVTGNLTPLDMTFNQVGTGYTSGWPATPGGWYSFIGTLDKVLVTTGDRMPGTVDFPAAGSDRIAFTPFAAGTYAITLGASDHNGDTGLTSPSSVTVFPAPSISGLPSNGSISAGTPLTLTASPTGAAGVSYLWQVADHNGQSATASQALHFDGVSQYVDLSNPTNLNFTGPITLEAWINPEASDGTRDMIAHGYQLSPNNNAEVFLRINNGNYEVGSWNGTGVSATAAMPAGDLGKWVHLAGVFDGSHWLLYRDGVLIGSSATTRQGALAVSSVNWAIGARGTGTDRFFMGSIDEVRIWKAGRSAAQVQADLGSRLTGNETNLMAYYRLDETSGTSATDATANQNTGTLGGGNPARLPTRVAGIVLGSTLAFTPTVAGANTVTLQVLQPDGGTGQASAVLTVSAGPPAGLDIYGQPRETVLGQYIPTVTVAVVDAHGNTVPDGDANASLSIASGPHGAKLRGHTTVRAVHGVATFSGLTVSKAGTYRLRVTGGKLTPDVSRSFTVKPMGITKHGRVNRGPRHHIGLRGHTARKPRTIDVTNHMSRAQRGPLALVLKEVAAGVTPARASGTD
jgi:hypothetical protein